MEGRDAEAMGSTPRRCGSPEPPTAHLNIASCWIKQGKLDEARAHLGRRCRSTPYSAGAPVARPAAGEVASDARFITARVGPTPTRSRCGAKPAPRAGRCSHAVAGALTYANTPRIRSCSTTRSRSSERVDPRPANLRAVFVRPPSRSTAAAARSSTCRSRSITGSLASASAAITSSTSRCTRPRAAALRIARRTLQRGRLKPETTDRHVRRVLRSRSSGWSIRSGAKSSPT